MFYLRLQLPQPSPTAFFGHPRWHNVAKGTSALFIRTSPHNPQILNLEPFAETDFSFSVHADRLTSASVSHLQSAHAACLISLSASNASPFFHTANVIAAILRAMVTRANSDRSPRPSNSAYQVLNGS